MRTLCERTRDCCAFIVLPCAMCDKMWATVSTAVRQRRTFKRSIEYISHGWDHIWITEPRFTRMCAECSRYMQRVNNSTHSLYVCLERVSMQISIWSYYYYEQTAQRQFGGRGAGNNATPCAVKSHRQSHKSTSMATTQVLNLNALCERLSCDCGKRNIEYGCALCAVVER